MWYWYGIQAMWLLIGTVIGFLFCAFLSSNDKTIIGQQADIIHGLVTKQDELIEENKKLNNLLDQIQDMTKKWG